MAGQWSTRFRRNITILKAARGLTEELGSPRASRGATGATYRGACDSELNERAQRGVRVRVNVSELHGEAYSANRVDDGALQCDLAGRQRDDDGGKLRALWYRAAGLDVTPALAQIADAGSLLAPLAVPGAFEILFEALSLPAFVHALCPAISRRKNKAIRHCRSLPRNAHARSSSDHAPFCRISYSFQT